MQHSGDHHYEHGFLLVGKGNVQDFFVLTRQLVHTDRPKIDLVLPIAQDFEAAFRPDQYELHVEFDLVAKASEPALGEVGKHDFLNTRVSAEVFTVEQILWCAQIVRVCVSRVLM